MDCSSEMQKGNCGWECEALINGECPIADELITNEITGDQLDILYDAYGIEDDTEWFGG